MRSFMRGGTLMIIRGTTPPIRFTFSDVNPLEMTEAYLTVCQNDVTIEKALSSASSVTDTMVGVASLAVA